MLTKEDLRNIKEIIDGRMDKVEVRLDKIEGELKELTEYTHQEISSVRSELKELTEYTRQEISSVRSELRGLTEYTHQKFSLMENDMMPKITALFDGRDLCVQQIECRENREKIECRLEYIDPLVQIVSEHSRKIGKYGEILQVR